MRIAMIAGGWHYPAHFYRVLAASADCDVELFCIGHRDPNLDIVRTEKADILKLVDGPLMELDRQLYESYICKRDLSALGWDYRPAANTVGDWGYVNQWLEMFDYTLFDLIVFAHDDTFIRRRDLFACIRELHVTYPEIILITNSIYSEAPVGYARGSFEVFTPQLLQALGGRIPLAETGLSREGKTDSPADMAALSAWNANGEPLRRFMNENRYQVGYLSSFYRVSDHMIEGERGFIHGLGGAPWSYNAGLKAKGVL